VGRVGEKAAAGTVAVAMAGVMVGAAKERHTLAPSKRARQRKRQLY